MESQQEFDPWGVVQQGGIASSTTTLNYTGQRRDDTGLVYYHARYYDPRLGRFLSPDTLVPSTPEGSMDGVALSPLTVAFHDPGFNAALGSEIRASDTDRDTLHGGGPFNPQDLNRYSYARNNPVRYTDPTGHCPLCAPALTLFAGFGITVSAPVVAAIVAVVSVAAIGVFLSDANNRAWLSDQLRTGIQDMEAFVGGFSERAVGKSGTVLEAKPSKKSGKEKGSDIPEWAKGLKKQPGESGKDAAKRILDERYGSGNYRTGPGSEYNKLKKYLDRKD